MYLYPLFLGMGKNSLENPMYPDNPINPTQKPYSTFTNKKHVYLLYKKTAP
jgi:hypothetical protein